MAKKVLTQNLSEPLGGATAARVELNTGSGNLAIDSLTSGEPLLASGTLEYLENHDQPTRSVSTTNGEAVLSVSARNPGRKGFRFPWSACNGETDWQIHLNPGVRSEITAVSGGGNVRLNLAGMSVTRVAANTGGGNMDLVLPDHIANLYADTRTGGGNVTVEIGRGTMGTNTVCANSGAGNVEVRVPDGIAALIHASSGLGKVIVDPRFVMIDSKTYQSPDYERAADKVEITAGSGAGNVTISSK